MLTNARTIREIARQEALSRWRGRGADARHRADGLIGRTDPVPVAGSPIGGGRSEHQPGDDD